MAIEQHAEVEAMLRFVLESLIDHPDELRLTMTHEGSHTAFAIHTHPRDTAKIIGKQGRTARSIRTILGAVGMRRGHRYSLDIVESDDQARWL